MIRAFLSVGLWTLASRITGFLRDILLAERLGAGLMMDAFSVAFRLPNHFRAIFAEGAFNTAFVPVYSQLRAGVGALMAGRFAGRILSLVLASQLLLLSLVLAATPGFVALLAPGFADRPAAMALAVPLTRITFPYLALVTLVVLWSGVLNAEKRFAAAAAAPVLLNAAMAGTLLFSAHFATPAHAAAYGVLIAGFLEAGLLAIAALRAGLLTAPRLPRFDAPVEAFFRAFLPAVLGAGGGQIAMLLDTILVTYLPPGSASALYYADRLYQFPIGVIGIAAGTVLLPEMSRLIAAGREAEAHRQQNRSLMLSWLLAAPFFVGFLLLPEAIMAGFFQRGAFSAQASAASAAVLAAYAIGLPAMVAIRSMVASFYARSDTRTPLIASLTAIGLNLLLKLVLAAPMGAAGLALATAIGALLNFAILFVLASRQGKAAPDALFGLVALIALTGAIWCGVGMKLLSPLTATLPPLPALLLLGLGGGGIYGGLVLAAFKILRIPFRLQ